MTTPMKVTDPNETADTTARRQRGVISVQVTTANLRTSTQTVTTHTVHSDTDTATRR